MKDFNVHVILDRDYLEICYGSLENPMTQALLELNIPFQIVHWRNRVFTEGFEVQNDNVIYGVVGSVSFCRNIGTILSSHVDMEKVFVLLPEQVKHYSNYSYMVSPELRLNKSGFMLPLGEIINQGVDGLKAITGYADGVFFKCDFGLKSAESEFVAWSDLHRWMEYTLNKTGASKESYFWLFPKKHILKEFRLAVINNKVVSACQYMDFKESKIYPTLSNLVPKEVYVIAEQTINQMQIPDDTYILDIAETPEGFSMVECNAISSSGWYCMDHMSLMKALTAKVSQIAEVFLDDMLV